MMNKIKSGRIAKLKALIAIPILMIAFMFFANMTNSNLLKSKITNNEIVGEKTATADEQRVTLPTAKEVKPFDKDFILCTLTLNENGFFYNGAKHDLKKVDKLVGSIDLSENKAKGNKMTVLLEIDESVKMGKVDQIKQALRNHDLLKIGHLVKGEKALFMLLPPKEAEFMDEDLVVNLYKINHSKKLNIKELSKDLTKYIYEHDKYIMLYSFDNNVSYAEYLGVVDMVFHSINNIRRAEAKKDGKDYNTLSNDEQKVYRKKYPITLTQKNIHVVR